MDAISETPNSLAPGAEDNASGTVIALEAARAMAGEDFGSTVKFVVFTGEEQGLIGSDHYARLLRGQNVDLLGALNFDMVSWYQDSFGVTIRTNTASMGLAQLENRMAAEYTTLAHFVTTQVGGSDHVSFHNQGYAATGTIEYGYPPIRYPYYHTIHDSLAYLSIPLAAEVAKMAIATLATLADSQTTSVEAGPPTLAFPTALFPVYPNPFWVTVRVEYSLAAKGRVRLSVYNVSGQMVRELVNQIQSPGKYSASWDGRNQKEYKVPSGVYFYRLQTETFSDTKKAVVVR
jgi:aminopeptidase YwaD